MKKSTTILLLALALVALLGGSTALYNKFSASALPQQQLAVEEGEGQVEESTGEADSA